MPRGEGSADFSPDGSQFLYFKGFDDSGTSGDWWYAIDPDGTGRHQVYLSDDPRYTCTADGGCMGIDVWASSCGRARAAQCSGR